MASVLTLADLDFSYGASPDFLFSNLNLSFSRGWTGIVGPNGSGKTTLSRLVCGRLDPLSGRVSGPSPATYCPQRTDFPPERVHEFLTVDCDGEAAYWRSRLKIGEDWFARWDTLSHGERKRAQLAVALWRGPAVLAADEPTNHLDRVAREPIAEALASYSGIGLLVSHDRDLLDRLCIRCLFIEPPRVRMFPGTYTEAVEQRDRENLHLRRERRRAEQNVAKVERQTARRRHVAAQSKHRNSGHGLDQTGSVQQDDILTELQLVGLNLDQAADLLDAVEDWQGDVDEFWEILDGVLGGDGRAVDPWSVLQVLGEWGYKDCGIEKIG